MKSFIKNKLREALEPNQHTIDSLLDRISAHGKESLSPYELDILKNIHNPEYKDYGSFFPIALNKKIGPLKSSFDPTSLRDRKSNTEINYTNKHNQTIFFYKPETNVVYLNYEVFVEIREYLGILNNDPDVLGMIKLWLEEYYDLRPAKIKDYYSNKSTGNYSYLEPIS